MFQRKQQAENLLKERFLKEKVLWVKNFLVFMIKVSVLFPVYGFPTITLLYIGYNNIIMDIKLTNLMIEILEKYTTIFDEPIYSRKLSVLINRNHRSIDICLKKMEDLKLLGSKRKGKEIEYYLNFNNPSINPFLCLSEETKLQKAVKKYPPSIKKTVFDLRKEFILYPNNLDFCLLFGSFAKDYYMKKSDLDLLIVAENKKIINKRIEKVENIWGVEISPIFMILKDFEHNLKTKNLTLQDILKNHLVLIGGENFWGEIIKWKL